MHPLDKVAQPSRASVQMVATVSEVAEAAAASGDGVRAALAPPLCRAVCEALLLPAAACGAPGYSQPSRGGSANSPTSRQVLLRAQQLHTSLLLELKAVSLMTACEEVHV